MNARIVRAAVEDLPAIAALAGEIWRAHYPGIISNAQIEYMLEQMYSMATLTQDLLARGIRYDRLLVDDEFVGFAAYGLESRLENRDDTVKLHKLYLHPQWHGKGFGSMLARHCEHQSRGMGAERLVLAVNKRNAKAIAAYQRYGFTITQSIVTDIAGGFVMDDYVMEKGLGA